MNTLSNVKRNTSLDRLELRNKPKLYITEKLQKQIDFLHGKVRNSEWSGELITREEGTISDLDGWKIYAEDMYLADIGSGVFTGYEVDKGAWTSSDIVDLYSAFPGLMEGTHKAQHIHTHHSMGAFFSGTDWENLHDRALASNYFLMLVVDFQGKYVAKVAFKGQIGSNGESVINIANNTDGFKPMKMTGAKEKEALVVMDCEVIYEATPVSIDTTFLDRYEAVKKIVDEEAKKKTTREPFMDYQQHGGAYSQPSIWEDTEDDLPYSKKSKTKKISEMTEKEWKNSQNAHYPPHNTFKLFQARNIINSILLGQVKKNGYHYADPVPELTDINKRILTEKEREVWVEKFMKVFPTALQNIYPNECSVDDEYQMLEMMRQALEPYQYVQLIDAIVDAIEVDMELYEDWEQQVTGGVKEEKDAFDTSIPNIEVNN